MSITAQQFFNAICWVAHSNEIELPTELADQLREVAVVQPSDNPSMMLCYTKEYWAWKQDEHKRHAAYLLELEIREAQKAHATQSPAAEPTPKQKIQAQIDAARAAGNEAGAIMLEGILKNL